MPIFRWCFSTASLLGAFRTQKTLFSVSLHIMFLVGGAELVFCCVLSLLDLLLGERIHLVHIDELWHEREFCHWRYKSWRNLKERNRLQGSECFAVLLIWRRIDIPSLNKGEAPRTQPPSGSKLHRRYPCRGDICSKSLY